MVPPPRHSAPQHLTGTSDTQRAAPDLDTTLRHTTHPGHTETHNSVQSVLKTHVAQAYATHRSIVLSLSTWQF